MYLKGDGAYFTIVLQDLVKACSTLSIERSILIVQGPNTMVECVILSMCMVRQIIAGFR